MSKKINFPASHYVGLITNRTLDNLPLAFMTPYGEDVAAKKRMATVDQWVSHNQGNHPVGSKTVIKNEPRAGFCLLDAVVHQSRYSTSVKWRLEDPLGFELEISSHNLMSIMQYSVVDKGEILDMCVWARDGNENVLVPVSSPVYEVMQTNTERMTKSASLRDLTPGDHVVMQNGYEGRYIGKFFEIERHYDLKIDSIRYGRKLSRKKFMFIHDNRVTTVASPKLSEITKGEPIEPRDGLAMLHAISQSYAMTNRIENQLVVEQATDFVARNYGEPSADYVVYYNQKYWSVFQHNYTKNLVLREMAQSAWLAESKIYLNERHWQSWVRPTDITLPSVVGLPLWVRYHRIVLDDGIVINM